MGAVDETMLAFGEDYSEGFEEGYDIFRISNPANAPFFVSEVEGKALAINRLPFPNENSTVPLSFIADNNGGNYNISMVKAPSDWQIYLEDKFTGAWHDLTNSMYNFKYSQNFRPQRFVLHFGNSSADINPTQGAIAWGTESGLIVRFNRLTSQTADVTITNLVGQVLYHSPAANTSEDLYIPILNQNAQVYIAHVQTAEYSGSVKAVR